MPTGGGKVQQQSQRPWDCFVKGPTARAAAKPGPAVAIHRVPVPLAVWARRKSGDLRARCGERGHTLVATRCITQLLCSLHT